MIIEEIKNIKSGKKELQRFGLMMGAFFALLGIFFLRQGRGDYFSSFFLSGVFFLFGLTFPNLLEFIYKKWMTLSVLWGWLVTRVILLILFYLVVTPIGITARLFSRDFLDLRFNSSTDSYWILRRRKRLKKDDFGRQF